MHTFSKGHDGMQQKQNLTIQQLHAIEFKNSTIISQMTGKQLVMVYDPVILNAEINTKLDHHQCRCSQPLS